MKRADLKSQATNTEFEGTTQEYTEQLKLQDILDASNNIADLLEDKILLRLAT